MHLGRSWSAGGSLVVFCSGSSSVNWGEPECDNKVWVGHPSTWPPCTSGGSWRPPEGRSHVSWLEGIENDDNDRDPLQILLLQRFKQDIYISFWPPPPHPRPYYQKRSVMIIMRWLVPFNDHDRHFCYIWTRDDEDFKKKKFLHEMKINSWHGYKYMIMMIMLVLMKWK